MTPRRHLVIFVKAPVAGRVKTRLAREIGARAAAHLYRRMTAHTIRRLGRGPWRLWLAVDPPAAVDSPVFWPAGIPRIAQGRGDLGTRLHRVFRMLPKGPAVIIGSDCPDISRHDIAAAFRSLATSRAVFGPATDGGYWLIGMKRPVPYRMFRGVRWSSETALSDTIANLSHTPAFLRTARDVDTLADLIAYGASGTLPRGMSIPARQREPS